MPFKEKAIVRHKLRPDWGAGRVLQRSDEYLQIDFTAGGLKKLKTSMPTITSRRPQTRKPGPSSRRR